MSRNIHSENLILSYIFLPITVFNAIAYGSLGFSELFDTTPPLPGELTPNAAFLVSGFSTISAGALATYIYLARSKKPE